MENFILVVKAATNVLIHTPGLTRYGSKPDREIAANPARLQELNGKLRTYAEARDYLPNQVFVGQQSPERLAEIPRPWFGHRAALSEERKSFGSVIDERPFLALVALAGPVKHGALLDRFWEETAPMLQQSPVCKPLAASSPNIVDANGLKAKIAAGG